MIILIIIYKSPFSPNPCCFFETVFPADGFVWLPRPQEGCHFLQHWDGSWNQAASMAVDLFLAGRGSDSFRSRNFPRIFSPTKRRWELEKWERFRAEVILIGEISSGFIFWHVFFLASEFTSLLHGFWDLERNISKPRQSDVAMRSMYMTLIITTWFTNNSGMTPMIRYLSSLQTYPLHPSKQKHLSHQTVQPPQAAPAPCSPYAGFFRGWLKKNRWICSTSAPGMNFQCWPCFPNFEKRQEVIWSRGPPLSAARLLGHTPWPWRCPPRRPTWRCSRPCMAQRPAGPRRCSGYGERRNATWRPMHLGKTWGFQWKTCVLRMQHKHWWDEVGWESGMREWYCWWFRNHIPNHLGCIKIIKPVVKTWDKLPPSTGEPDFWTINSIIKIYSFQRLKFQTCAFWSEMFPLNFSKLVP